MTGLVAEVKSLPMKPGLMASTRIMPIPVK
jgi:hypothetical protein